MSQKIFFVFSKLNKGGGAEKQVLIQAQSLIKHGYDILFLTKKIDTDHFYRYCPSGSFSTDIKFMLSNANGNLTFSFLADDHLYCLIPAIKKRIKWVPFEQTHPLFYQKYTDNIFFVAMIKFFILRVLYSFFTFAIITQTKSAKKAWELLLYKKQKNIFVINNIVDIISDMNLKKYAVTNSLNPFQIIMVGRFASVKNYEYAFQVFKILYEKYFSFSVSIFGDGPLKKDLLKLRHKLNLDSIIHFKGFTDSIMNEYKKYDIFVMTSNAEGMPNALCEAMAAGCICVTRDLNGVAYEIMDNSLMIVDKLDPPIIFADKINTIYNKLYMSEYNQNNIKNKFSEENFISQFEIFLKYFLSA